MVDMSTKRILFLQDADKPMQPASLTKILSLYLAYEALRAGRIHIQDIVKISEKAWRTGGSKMYVEVDTEVPLTEIIKGVAIVSANDASVALAEHVDGDVEHFVAHMNAKARELGMTHSRFGNPHGLPDKDQVSTAWDIMRLAWYYLYRYPQALNVHVQRWNSYNGIVQKNRNRLLGRCPGVDGLKTGYVTKAGYHIIVTARRGDTRLLLVLMGAPNPAIRARESTRLIEEGFRMVADARMAPGIAKDTL